MARRLRVRLERPVEGGPIFGAVDAVLYKLTPRGWVLLDGEWPDEETRAAAGEMLCDLAFRATSGEFLQGDRIDDEEDPGPWALERWGDIDQVIADTREAEAAVAALKAVP